MKKHSALGLFLILSATTVFGDDGGVFLGAGGVEYLEGTMSPTVQLKTEVIDIAFQEDLVRFAVQFDFWNDGEEATYHVGFPEKKFSNYDDLSKFNTAINGFKTTVNGEVVPFEISTKTTEKSVERWFLKTVTFKKNSHTLITVAYSSEYGYGPSYPMGPNRVATYFYGSAHNWKGNIETFTINVENNTNWYIGSYHFGIPKQQSVISLTGTASTRVTLNDVKPSKDAEIEFWLWPVETIGPYGGDDDKATTKNTPIKRDRIVFYSANQLRLLRNQIFAMNGYKFKSPDLVDFFNRYFTQYGYSPKYDNVDGFLNSTERDSIAIISSIEKERGQN